ncbi:protein NRT1/ PTR FAMILY 5.4-like [Prosopis cineraria]|uniref:protein NRT1/ PTR FAMILY 5.4-like n=1 Tax=Prosopis cineraria TaxID=364024 RepID=UPI00240F28C6|nr:protein NRT1/ PTR FAMILY 5.4-like [Prosopis cineraria]
MAENRNGNAGLLRNQPSTRKGGWHAAIFIICVEFADRFAYYGLSGNLVQYLTEVLHQSITTATKNVNTFIGVSSLFPLLGGFIADSYFGRFNTIVVSSIIYLVGMILLTLSASALKNNWTSFSVALYILSVGDGGHKPCVQTFAANQFDDDSPEQKIAKNSFFNYWYLGLVAAGLTSSVVIYIEDNIGWATGLAILAATVAVALVLFLLGIKTYRKDGPTGSPFTRMAQVFVAAIRKWRVNTTRDPHSFWYGEEENKASQPKSCALAHTDQFRFLDKAMIIDELDASSKTTNPWRLSSVTQVEEVKLVLRLVPIWLCGLMFFVVQSQLHTFIVKQGQTMVRSIGPHFRIPPASLQSIVGVMIVAAVLVYDRVFIPFARKFTGHPSGITVLQRIGAGLFVSIINMIVGGLLEAKRVSIARENHLLDDPKAELPMSIWWMIPQYFIFGVSDALAVVGLQQLFYDEVAETMRSLAAAAYISLLGFGTLASNVVITVVEYISSRNGEKWLGSNLNRAHIDYFYWVLAGLSAVNLCVYVLVARNFVYKEVDDEVVDPSINTNHNQV